MRLHGYSAHGPDPGESRVPLSESRVSIHQPVIRLESDPFSCRHGGEHRPYGLNSDDFGRGSIGRVLAPPINPTTHRSTWQPAFWRACVAMTRNIDLLGKGLPVLEIHRQQPVWRKGSNRYVTTSFALTPRQTATRLLVRDRGSAKTCNLAPRVAHKSSRSRDLAGPGASGSGEQQPGLTVDTSPAQLQALSAPPGL